MRFPLTAIGLMLALGAATAASAADYEIEMLNEGSDGEWMVFEPAVLRIAPGDTVTFVPTDPGHNAETIAGMIPEGAEPFVGGLDEQLTVTFGTEGVYGIACAPHYFMGMVALIVVGEAEVEGVEALPADVPEGARERFDVLFAELEALE